MPTIESCSPSTNAGRRSARPPLEFWPSIAEFFLYDQFLYGAMIGDQRRNRAYRDAVAQHVRSKVVVEVGPGPEALLSRLCVEAGARTVYAIEYLESTYQQCAAFLQANGLDERIVLIRGDAREVSLPCAADVCVSEIVGAIGGAEGSPSIVNAARRFLRPGGVMIPSRSITKIAAVELPVAPHEPVRFAPLAEPYVHRIFDDVGRRFDLRVCVQDASSDWLRSTAGDFEYHDYNDTLPLEYRRTFSLEITTSGRMDGFLVWLTLETTPGITLDILANRHCWLPVYFPIFEHGQPVEPGDRIALTVRSRPCRNGLNPDYHVSGTLQRRFGGEVPFLYDSPHFGRGFRQTPFYENLFGGW